MLQESREFMTLPSRSGDVFQFENGRTPVKVPRKRGRPKGAAKRTVRIVPRCEDSFDFVHVDCGSKVADEESRKTIRRRVMINYINVKRKQQSDDTLPSCSLSPQVGGFDSFGALPIECEPYMLDLLRFHITTGWTGFYAIEKFTRFNPMTEYWLSFALTDSAFLHTILGCADLHLSPNGICDRPRTLKHLNAAISIVNQRLENDELPTEATLVVVATMAILEKSRGAHDNWKIHMKGLSRLIDLHGGFKALESVPMVLSKLYRADLAGSIDAVQIPHFSTCWIPSPIRPSNKSINMGFQVLKLIMPLDQALISCIQTLTETTRVMQSLSTTSGEAEAATVRYWITASQYSLLSVEYHDPFHEICRLALLIFSDIFINEDIGRIPIYDQLVTNFWRHVSSDPGRFSAIPSEFNFWVLFLANLATTSRDLAECCGQALAEVASAMKIFTWEDAKSVLESFLWCSTFEENRFKALWCDMRASQATIC